jgi:hypothetical protein
VSGGKISGHARYGVERQSGAGSFLGSSIAFSSNTLGNVLGLMHTTSDRFELDANGYYSIIGGNPLLSFDSNDYMTYDRTNNTMAVYIGGTSKFFVNSSGPVLTTPVLGTPASGNLANCTFPTLNQSTSGTASNITAYTINQSVGTGNSPSFVDVTITSDESVKTNWRDFAPDMLTKFATVKHGIYDRTDVVLTQAGVSANSFQAVLPEGVTTGENGLLQISQSATLAIVAELTALVLRQEKRIADLEARL